MRCALAYSLSIASLRPAFDCLPDPFFGAGMVKRGFFSVCPLALVSWYQTLSLLLRGFSGATLDNRAQNNLRVVPLTSSFDYEVVYYWAPGTGIPSLHACIALKKLGSSAFA